MCEDTVFWDLNYAIKYKSLGTEEIRSKVLVLMETLDERLFEHPNFVWLGTIHNVCHAEKRTKRSSNILLRLVCFSA